jgi:hypothetical protein
MRRRNFIKTGLIFVPGWASGAVSIITPQRIPIAAAGGGGGSISLVQSSGAIIQDSISNVTGSLTSVTAGNLVVLTIALASSDSIAIPTPTGWSVAEAPTASLASGDPNYKPIVGIFYKAAAASGTHSFTTTRSAGAFAISNISEWNITQASPLDVHTNSKDGGSGATSGNTGTTGTTAQASELAIVVIDPENGANTSSLSTPPSSGYTSLAYSADDNTHNACSHGYKILAATGTQVGSWTWSNSSGWCAAIATFKS